MTIGFIGLGIMGSRMAANLASAGHTLVVHNRTREKADPLLARGAGWADTPAALAGQVDVLITMLATPEAVLVTAGGDDGFLDHLPQGALWVDVSTVNPSFSHAMAQQARGRGVRFLDAPVAGTKGPAERGELLFLVGGEADDVAAARPLFDAMGRDVLHAGGHGSGAALKMVVNLLLGQAMAAFSEGLALGEALGFDRGRLLDVLLETPVVAPFLAGKREMIERDDFPAAFPLKWMRKDLQLAAQTAYEEDVSLPMTNAAKELYALAGRHGLADHDFSAVLRFLDRRER